MSREPIYHTSKPAKKKIEINWSVKTRKINFILPVLPQDCIKVQFHYYCRWYMLRPKAVTSDGTWPRLRADDQVQNMPLPHICHRVSRMTCQAHYTWSFSCHTREHMGHLLPLPPTLFYSDIRRHILPLMTSQPKRRKLYSRRNKENSDLNMIHVKALNYVRVGSNFFTFKKRYYYEDHVAISLI